MSEPKNEPTIDFFRLVYDRSACAGTPDSEARAVIYAECRAWVRSSHADTATRESALASLEKVIRRQEMQALYEETRPPKTTP